MGKGIGDVTVNIFLRELRTVWKKANPQLSDLVTLAAKHLSLIQQRKDALRSLNKFWSTNKVKGNQHENRRTSHIFSFETFYIIQDSINIQKYGICPSISESLPQKKNMCCIKSIIMILFMLIRDIMFLEYWKRRALFF